jgi:hypothetical protein
MRAFLFIGQSRAGKMHARIAYPAGNTNKKGILADAFVL